LPWRRDMDNILLSPSRSSRVAKNGGALGLFWDRVHC